MGGSCGQKKLRCQRLHLYFFLLWHQWQPDVLGRKWGSGGLSMAMTWKSLSSQQCPFLWCRYLHAATIATTSGSAAASLTPSPLHPLPQRRVGSAGDSSRVPVREIGRTGTRPHTANPPHLTLLGAAGQGARRSLPRPKRRAGGAPGGLGPDKGAGCGLGSLSLTRGQVPPGTCRCSAAALGSARLSGAPTRRVCLAGPGRRSAGGAAWRRDVRLPALCLPGGLGTPCGGRALTRLSSQVTAALASLPLPPSVCGLSERREVKIRVRQRTRAVTGGLR